VGRVIFLQISNADLLKIIRVCMEIFSKCFVIPNFF